jgi:predicted choloylglycine hydrolase
MSPAEVPTYTIDLARPESTRWAGVIACQKESAARLVQEAVASFERVPELLRWVFARLYQFYRGLYRGEILAWAEALGVSEGTATILNCAYELSHFRWSRVFGCTAGIRWIDGLGLVHARALDWPLPSMIQATCLFRFRRAEREFVVVGVPGQVGVLSGMLPGAYSATINWAPPGPRPTFDFGPTFLLRDTLETCSDYESAVEVLKTTPISTSVFFTVCGVEPGQACVIERTQRATAVRPMNGPVLVQANHHVAPRFLKLNEELPEAEEGEAESFHQDSARRVATFEQVLAGLTSCTLDEAARSLTVAPVQNQYTCQQMVFCPRAGLVKVWRPASP